MSRTDRGTKVMEGRTARTFKALRLGRQDQRDRYLGLRQAAHPGEAKQIVYFVRLSNNSEPASKERSDAQLTGVSSTG